MLHHQANIPSVNHVGLECLPDVGEKSVSDLVPIDDIGALFQPNVMLLSILYADFVPFSCDVCRMLSVISICRIHVHHSLIGKFGLIVARWAMAWYLMDLTAVLAVLMA